ncbi:hypothetical protein L873DRAFT_1847545 [Choiromyces venosus 120613-1]|uniref:Uncharacterized protein n=1 Tax=Choiromyces venosus 120613-1 TaxID=1336337 RepID=A0A3N4J360_9PEZI|nr:hypothetical protein L873DRAFT_1847545 [Choiromyces venosus 120613-1]
MTEMLKGKRRNLKIKEWGEQLDASLAKESSHLTGILKRIATTLVPTGTSITTLPSQPSDMQLPAELDKTKMQFKSLETHLETAEQTLEKVKGNIVEILRILQ